MSHRLRFLPPTSNGRNLVEVTLRCFQGRYLLRPSDELNLRVSGVLGRSLRLFSVQLHGCVFLSNHGHLLVTVTSQKRLSSFMNYLNSNLAREVNRLHGWSDKLWSGRYSATPVIGGEASEVERFQYLLAQGTKEGLVDSPLVWPGVHCGRALVSGKPLKGKWIDRTGLYEARQKLPPGKVRAIDFEEEELVEFTPLPCWQGLSVEEYQKKVAELIASIETSARTARRGARVLGRRAILRQHPHHRPEPLKKTPEPIVHAPSREHRRSFLEAYRFFTASFRVAALLLKQGHLGVQFPEGSFPPPRPFVEIEVVGPRPG